MTEPTPPRPQPAAPGGATAGALLRAARERQGLPVDTLAAVVKVPPRKLAALEADRYDELPDPAFTRALARTLCRLLEIDAEPVLAQLPPPPNIGPRLERVHNGLDGSLRPHGGADAASRRQLGLRPALWLPLLLLLAAAIVWLVPQDWASRGPLATGDAAAPAPAAADQPPGAADVAGQAASAGIVVEPVGPEATTTALPPAVAEAAAPAASAAIATGLLQVSVAGEAWMEVVDARDTVLLRRTLRAGESLDLDGMPPLRLRIGHAAGVKLRFRGRPVDLPASRGQGIRLELK